MPLATASPPDTTLWDVLGTVADPEYPMSIVDLGLIYEARADRDATHIRMTFTTIGCPGIEMIVGDIEAAIAAAGMPTARVEIVWDPPWTKDLISTRGRKVLASYGVT